MDREYPQDEKTILLDRQGRTPAQGPVTDFASPPRFEQLEDRMIYAARMQGAEHFNVGLNSLVAPAWALLSEVVQLKRSTSQESLRGLNERLSSAVTLFETRARHDGAQTSEVMAARYVLCSVIDEAVVTTSWGSQSDWSKMSLLSSFHNETFGGEKFFQLLERMSRDPFKHLAMLELMYLCLSLGFEGKYRVWRGTAARLLTISGLFLLWGLAMVYANWRSMTRQQTVDSVEQRPGKGQIENEQRQLRGRFKDALYTLKNSSIYGDRSPRWRNALPWYLLSSCEPTPRTLAQRWPYRPWKGPVAQRGRFSRLPLEGLLGRGRRNGRAPGGGCCQPVGGRQPGVVAWPG